MAATLVAKPARKYWAEAIGTFWLVFAGAATVLFDSGTGNIGIATAFGLTVVTMAYAIGRISGGHFNSAVSVGAVVAGRMPANELIPYIVSQLVGGTLAALLLWVIATGKAGAPSGGFASTGYGEHSPGGFSLASAAIAEIVATGFFVLIILGVTAKKAHPSLAPLAIGLALTLVHFAILPISGASVNPARSSATAIVAAISGTTWPLVQLWLFWVAPIIGAAIAGWAYKEIFADE